MAVSRTGAGNSQDVFGACCNAIKLKSAQNKSHIDRNMSKGPKSQLKEFPVAKAGKI